MTSAEAINELVRFVHLKTTLEPTFVSVAVEALKRQEPIEPILKHDVSFVHLNRGNLTHEIKRTESDNFHCPICDGFVGELIIIRDRQHRQNMKKFCEKCGQAIDWSNEND